MQIQIRDAVRQDSSSIYSLIMELAIYENGEKEVTNSIHQLEQDGFSNNPLYHCIVADSEMGIIGMSLTYFRYSTWKGKRLYLEDLIVREAYRGRGIGHLLWDSTVAFAKNQKCSGLSFQVLDWNLPAIEFYQNMNCQISNEWINCSLDW